MTESKWRFENLIAENVPKGEPFLCMFSGGKDSVLALSKVCERGGIPVGLLYCNSAEDTMNEYVFHWQSIQNINLQASMMRIPLIHYDGPWYRWDKILKNQSRGVKYIVFGDLNLIDNLKLQSLICTKAGLIPCFPLWNTNYNILMDYFEESKVETIITTIDPKSGISEDWLGRRYNRDTYNEFKGLKIDPFGENGEFHTYVINCNMFERRLHFELNERKGHYISIVAH